MIYTVYLEATQRSEATLYVKYSMLCVLRILHYSVCIL